MYTAGRVGVEISCSRRDGGIRFASRPVQKTAPPHTSSLCDYLTHAVAMQMLAAIQQNEHRWSSSLEVSLWRFNWSSHRMEPHPSKIVKLPKNKPTHTQWQQPTRSPTRNNLVITSVVNHHNTIIHLPTKTPTYNVAVTQLLHYANHLIPKQQ